MIGLSELSTSRRPVAILLAKSAIAAMPIAEMRALADAVLAQGLVAAAHIAFSEQGVPSLRDQVMAQVDSGAATILLIPIMIPAEPSYAAWLGRALARWQREYGQREHKRREGGGHWPAIHIAPALGGLPAMAALLGAAVEGALRAPPVVPPPAKAVEGSIVPPQTRRVLVCHGGPCTAAGAPLMWGHLRNAQARLSLRTQGEGMMSAKTTCLGPCNLAPVVQVCPENSYYGGVDEAAIDAIIQSHLIGGIEHPDHAYPADGKKQFLRKPR